MAVYPMTQRQFYNVKGWYPTDCVHTPDTCRQPVTGTSYETLRGSNLWPKDGDLVGSSSFFKTLRDASKIASFDLPTDAQWEYACRAGSPTAYNDGSEYNGSAAHACAWTTENSGNRIHDVGSLPNANAFGLYDMHGNMWELVKDMFSNGSEYSNTLCRRRRWRGLRSWREGGAFQLAMEARTNRSTSIGIRSAGISLRESSGRRRRRALPCSSGNDRAEVGAGCLCAEVV